MVNTLPSRLLFLGLLLLTARLTLAQNASPYPRFDFTRPETVREWQPTHDVARLVSTPQGMSIEISGGDPYIVGSARDYPEKQPLWLTVRFKSEQSGTGQVFYYGPNSGPAEENSVRFPARGNGWETARIPCPPLGKGYSLRIDPPGTGGKVLLASIEFAPRFLLKEPQWPLPIPPVFRADALRLTSGEAELVHNRDLFGGFALNVAGERMAVGNARPLIGYQIGRETRWFNLASSGRSLAALENGALKVETVVDDPDGARWTIRQRFTPTRRPGGFSVQTSVLVSQERNVVYLPLLTLLPGVNSFGESKGQGLFAGLEYLEDEPSSSEKDIEGPGAKRQVPDTYRVTFPLMVVQAKERFVGLMWEPSTRFAPLYDSPDRQFKSGGHLMGLLFPGSNGEDREEGSLLPYTGQILAPGRTLTLNATILGGRGNSVLPAVQEYVTRTTLPTLPNRGLDWEGYTALASAGYLDSKLTVNNQFRHAYPGDFGPNIVADAPLFMEYLAGQTKDKRLAARLETSAKAALAKVTPEALLTARVSHVFYPVAPLVYGQASLGAAQSVQRGQELLRQFESDGTVLYRKPASGLDFGRTHSAPDANGLAAPVVAAVLESALFSGDAELKREALKRLHALDKFDYTPPRGAQTWEVPLHTPDILASAHLIRAYVMGYELTGEKELLDRAVMWAWTGVPFVYLVEPTEGKVGLYGTTPVFGATQWKAPNWMGLPVQWCGLVYSDALYRLARYVNDPHWRQIADGIAVSGVQQTWPLKLNPERQGLLPDSFSLRPQVRNDVAINPGTLLASALRLYRRPEIYDYRVFRKAGMIVHAPGELANVQEGEGRAAFTVHGWSKRPYQVLIVGLTKKPVVRVNGKAVSLEAPNSYDEKSGRLVLEVSEKAEVEITGG